MLQRTIRREIQLTGIGLHSGKKSTVSIIPASENTGIYFLRDGVRIPALATYVTNTTLSTTLEHLGKRIQTVEHILSAISYLMIDNLYIECSCDEIPIMDGSSNPFVFVLLEAGLKYQQAHKKFLKINKPIMVQNGDKFAKLIPSDRINYSLSIEFNHPLIDEYKHIEFDMGEDYINMVSRARTFGFLKDIEHLQRNNLALGGSTNNAIVLSEFDMINEDSLRYPDEFVRHKLVDAIGDLRLLGYNFIGDFHGNKTGHHLNVSLAKSVLEQKAYSIVDYKIHDLINNFITSQTPAEVL